MYDIELVIEILRQIHEAAQTILKRFEPVKTTFLSWNKPSIK